MNSSDKEQLVKALCRLSANLCSYSKKPCDCKFMQDEDKHIASGSERGSGCPETMIAAMLLAHMTEQEFLAIARRAGITITKDDDLKPLDVPALVNKFQEERWEKNQSEAQRVANNIRKKKV